MFAQYCQTTPATTAGFFLAAVLLTMKRISSAVEFMAPTACLAMIARSGRATRAMVSVAALQTLNSVFSSSSTAGTHTAGS